MRTHVIELTKWICILSFFYKYYSRETWIYFLKSKDKVFGKFKEFKALVENHNQKKIKTWRSKNVGEFTSESFKTLRKESWINRDMNTPYNLQQNGIIERKSITIMEAIKTMIHDQDLLLHLWAKESKTTVYV